MIRRLFSFADFEGEEGCQMATRGRKPTPTAIKELEGNPGKRKINEAEPKPEKKAPPCPKWLEPEAKKEWRRLSKQLEQIGVLTEVDQAAFASYCQASYASPKPQQTDNEKYAMRCWMLRLGFIGDEFETAREILLKNMDGNAAWRQDAC